MDDGSSSETNPTTGTQLSRINLTTDVLDSTNYMSTAGMTAITGLYLLPNGQLAVVGTNSSQAVVSATIDSSGNISQATSLARRWICCCRCSLARQGREDVFLRALRTRQKSRLGVRLSLGAGGLAALTDPQDEALARAAGAGIQAARQHEQRTLLARPEELPRHFARESNRRGVRERRDLDVEASRLGQAVAYREAVGVEGLDRAVGIASFEVGRSWLPQKGGAQGGAHRERIAQSAGQNAKDREVGKRPDAPAQLEPLSALARVGILRERD